MTCEICGENDDVKLCKIGEKSIMELCKECRKTYLHEKDLPTANLSKIRLVDHLEKDSQDFMNQITQRIQNFDNSGLYELIGQYRYARMIQFKIERGEFDPEL